VRDEIIKFTVISSIYIYMIIKNYISYIYKMPYEIKEKKGKKFSVVNKETGKVMSKGTTKEKAKKQVKAIYANMKPEHRIRHRIGLIDGMAIENPVHRGIIKEVKKLLKKEEIHGNGFWEWLNFTDPKEHPILSLVLGGTKPSDVVNAVKDYGLEAVTALVEPWTFPLAVANAVNKTPSYSAPSLQSASAPAQDDPYAYDFDQDYRDDYEYQNQPEDEDEEEDYEEEGVEEMIKKESTPKSSLVPLDQLDKIVEKVVEQINPMPLDEAIRFPMIYNYDENNKPMHLQEWLISNGVAGHKFSVEEFGNTYKNQQPYNFLNFPINGGRLGKINYSKLGYSKY